MKMETSSAGLAKTFYLRAVVMFLALGSWGCAEASGATNDAKTAVTLGAMTSTPTIAAEKAPFVFFEGGAKKAAPPEVDEFVTDFFEALKKTGEVAFASWIARIITKFQPRIEA
jgi:hypothetical protein